MCNLILDFRNFGYNNPCGQARLKRAPKVVNIAEWVRKPLKPQGLSVTSYGFLLSREYPTTFPAPQTKLKALRYAKYPKVSPYGIQWPYYSKVCNLILDFRNFGYNNPRGQARLKRAPKVVNIMVVLGPSRPRELQGISCWYSFLRSYPLAPLPSQHRLNHAIHQSTKKYQHCIQWPYYSRVCNLILDFRNFGYNNPCDGSALAGRPPERVSVMVGLTRPLQSQGLQKIACWYSFLRSYPLILFPLKRFICVIRQNSQKKYQHCIQWPYYSKVCNLILDFRNFGYNNPCAGHQECPSFSVSAMALLAPLATQGLLIASCRHSFPGSTPLIPLPLKHSLSHVIRQNVVKKKYQHCIQWPYYSRVCNLILDLKKFGYNSSCGKHAHLNERRWAFMVSMQPSQPQELLTSAFRSFISGLFGSIAPETTYNKTATVDKTATVLPSQRQPKHEGGAIEY
ncbi:hypothetical protein HHE01_00300 [Helicobacter heilmannii]|uniref:Uncharacterized protein n=1 Tax=Helicobacter heilmannii TaxID=35817 RepID=A0A0K2YA21_HELHE|nr:hypothetical protein HHE01_00300 [Helicobacter heilmannii]